MIKNLPRFLLLVYRFKALKVKIWRTICLALMQLHLKYLKLINNYASELYIKNYIIKIKTKIR